MNETKVYFTSIIPKKEGLWYFFPKKVSDGADNQSQNGTD